MQKGVPQSSVSDIGPDTLRVGQLLPVEPGQGRQIKCRGTAHVCATKPQARRKSWLVAGLIPLTRELVRRNFFMRRHLEIERKFLVRQPPAGWKSRDSSHVIQGYFPIVSKDLEVRLRHKGSKRLITIKSGHGRRRLEEEIEIPKEKFRSLWPLTRAARIAKQRYRIPCHGHTIEMDVYKGPHRGLITAEIEFDSARASGSFQPPDWFGREITGNRKYANEALARRQGLSRKRKHG
jgi:adenylate cyclase